jgi:hypothetical protein
MSEPSGWGLQGVLFPALGEAKGNGFLWLRLLTTRMNMEHLKRPIYADNNDQAKTALIKPVPHASLSYVYVLQIGCSVS